MWALPFTCGVHHQAGCALISVLYFSGPAYEQMRAVRSGFSKLLCHSPCGEKLRDALLCRVPGGGLHTDGRVDLHGFILGELGRRSEAVSRPDLRSLKRAQLTGSLCTSLQIDAHCRCHVANAAARNKRPENPPRNLRASTGPWKPSFV